MFKDYCYIFYFKEEYGCVVKHIKDNDIKQTFFCSNKFKIFNLTKIFEKKYNKELDFDCLYEIIFYTMYFDNQRNFEYYYSRINNTFDKITLFIKIAFVKKPIKFEYYEKILTNTSNTIDINDYKIIGTFEAGGLLNTFYKHFDLNRVAIMHITANENPLNLIKKLVENGADCFYLMIKGAILTQNNLLFKFALENAKIIYEKNYEKPKIEIDESFGFLIPIPSNNENEKVINIYEIKDNEELTDEMTEMIDKKLNYFNKDKIIYKFKKLIGK